MPAPRRFRFEERVAGFNPALTSTAPHYGLRYGFASATGDFQRLRGRPPLVNPLKSCIGRSFAGGNRGSKTVARCANPAYEHPHEFPCFVSAFHEFARRVPNESKRCLLPSSR